MATFKVKFRKSSIGKEGIVAYQIIHKGNKVLISTDMKLFENEWDEKFYSVKSARIETLSFADRIKSDILLLEQIEFELIKTGMPYTAKDIAIRFKTGKGSIGFLSYMRLQIETLNKRGHFGTANNYLRTLNSFQTFMNGYNIDLQSVSETIVLKYNQYLESRGVLRNSISFYMRNLRSVYNKAVRQRLVIQTNPFQNVYTGVDKTKKRAIQPDIISTLYKADFSHQPQLQLARDIFMFSFFTRGMSFVDIAYLRKSSIQNGMIYYTRRKTNQLLAIRIEPVILGIINKYSMCSSFYVFPILKSIDKQVSYNQYKVAVNKCNNNLKKISKILNIDINLTSYVARHTWATMARNSNIPVSVISAALGHSSEQTTQIYLASIDNSKIDEANSRIISLVDM